MLTIAWIIIFRDAVPYSCVRRPSSAFVLPSGIQLAGGVASRGNNGLSRILRGVEVTSRNFRTVFLLLHSHLLVGF